MKVDLHVLGKKTIAYLLLQNKPNERVAKGDEKQNHDLADTSCNGVAIFWHTVSKSAVRKEVLRTTGS